MNNPVVTINTEDPLEREIIEMYWQLNSEARFHFSVSALVERYEKPQKEITALAKEKSSFELFCKECGDSIAEGSVRSGLNNFWNNHVESEFYCYECAKIARSKSIRKF